MHAGVETVVRSEQLEANSGEVLLFRPRGGRSCLEVRSLPLCC
jgi:hypothetical protein